VTWLHALLAGGAAVSLAALGFVLWRTERKLRGMEMLIGQAQKHMAKAEAEAAEAHRDAETHRRGADLTRSQLHREQEVTRGLRDELKSERDRAEKAREDLAAAAKKAARDGDATLARKLLDSVLRPDEDDHAHGDGAGRAGAGTDRSAPAGTDSTVRPPGRR
jgi:hypothetical protein